MSKESWFLLVSVVSFFSAIISGLWNSMQIRRTLLAAPMAANAKEEQLGSEEVVIIKRSALKTWAIFSIIGLAFSSIGFYLSLAPKSINTVVTLLDVTPAYGSIPFKPSRKVSFNIYIYNLGPLPVAQDVRWDA